MSRIAVLVCVLMSVVSAEPTVRAESMNLLIIQTDEHNFRTLGCYRDTLPDDLAFVWGKDAVVETPAIDSIAARGAICTSFYATSPVCTPSRAAFFTGRYPHNTGSYQNDRPLRNDMVTFAESLRQNGYATGYAGKWHLDGSGKPQWAPNRQFGFADNRFMFNRGHWKKFVLTVDGPRVGSRNAKKQPDYKLNGADEKTFSTDWLTDRAIEFVQENSDKPFCYHLSLPDPHGPNTVRPPYDEAFADTPVRPPATFAAKSTPDWLGSGDKNRSLKFNASLMQTYFGMVKCIDDNVARILATLDELNLTDRTIVVFTSDHGDLCFEHGRLNKGNPYEGSAKIPMIIAAPGKIPAGTRVDQALGTVDFAPTVLALLGQSGASGMEGRDASGLLRGETGLDWNDVTFMRSASAKPAWMAAISDRHKLIVSVSGTPWLLDLDQDPNELENHIADPDQQAAAQSLARELLTYGDKTQDPQLVSGPLREKLESMLTP